MEATTRSRNATPAPWRHLGSEVVRNGVPRREAVVVVKDGRER